MPSKIEWTDETWNPATGCTQVSAGCDNCYARAMARRLGAMNKRNLALGRKDNGYHPDHPFNVTLHPDRLLQPLRWRKPRMIFVVSMGDLFHVNVPDEFIDRVFAVMAACPQHTFQVLTKRPERMAGYCNETASIQEQDGSYSLIKPLKKMLPCDHLPDYDPVGGDFRLHSWPLANIWLGTSIEDQATAAARIPHLLKCPAAVRYVSAEPLLGAIDCTLWTRSLVECDECGCQFRVDGQPDEWNGSGCSMCDSGGLAPVRPRIDWVIAGGESGSKARPMASNWVRSIRDACAAAGVAFYLKQMEIDGKLTHMPMLDGVVHDAVPGERKEGDREQVTGNRGKA